MKDPPKCKAGERLGADGKCGPAGAAGALPRPTPPAAPGTVLPPPSVPNNPSVIAAPTPTPTPRPTPQPTPALPPGGIQPPRPTPVPPAPNINPPNSPPRPPTGGPLPTPGLPPQQPPRPTPAPTPIPGQSPEVKVRLSSQGNELVPEVSFSSVAGVSNVTYSLGSAVQHSGAPAGAAFNVNSFAIPVTIRFNFSGRNCSVNTTAGFSETVSRNYTCN